MNRFGMACCVGVCLMGMAAILAGDREERKKQTAKEATGFVYPGSKVFEEFNTGVIAQFNYASEDELEKVDAWYRTRLGVDKDDHNGVSFSGKRLQSLFEDGHRPKSEKGIAIRKHTTRTHFLKTPDFTLVVVLNRLEADKQTLISLTYVPEAKK